MREYDFQPDVARFPALRVSWLPSWSVAPGGPWQWAVSNALDKATAPRKNVAFHLSNEESWSYNNLKQVRQQLSG